MNRKALARRAYNTAVDRVVRTTPEPVVTELRAVDCNTPEQWAQLARQRVEYEDPYGYQRGRRY